MIVKKIDRRVSGAKKRVAAYCRVSTLRDEQEESFETQKAYYTDLIRKNPDWEMVKIYADRHSATSAGNRPGFQEMMADTRDRRIDLILVKSVSRFARNVVDCQQYIQRLTTFDCCVYFEREHIRTDDPASSFVLSLLSAVAQDESRSISKNVQMGYESRFRRGEYNLGSNRILGYDCEAGKLVPNGDAWVVREVFSRFLAGESYRRIAEGIAGQGAKSLRGKARFSVGTIRYMLSNETYVGDKLLHKGAPRDYLTGQLDLNRSYEQHYLRDDHEAIIDRDTWNRAQNILRERKELAKAGIYQTNGKHHIFYGKVFCGECGAPYLRRTLTCSGKPGTYQAWNCRNRQKGKGERLCGNRFIREDHLLGAILGELGWERMDEERFDREIGRVELYRDHIEILRA